MADPTMVGRLAPEEGTDMAWRVTSAATLPELLPELEAAVGATASALRLDPLQRWPVLVPHHLVGEWLRLDLANRFAGGFDPDLPTLPDGLWALWQRALGPGAATFRPLSAAHLRDLILSVLVAPPAQPPVTLQPLWHYVYRTDAPPPAPPADQPDWWRRAWQLAERQAEAFLRYEWQGLDLDSTAAPGGGGKESGGAFHLAWQRELRALLLGPAGLRARLWPDRRTLGELASLPLPAANHQGPDGRGGLPPLIIAFGFDFLPPLAITLLQQLAQITTVALFLLDTGARAVADESVAGDEPGSEAEGGLEAALEKGDPFELWREPFRATCRWLARAGLAVPPDGNERRAAGLAAATPATVATEGASPPQGAEGAGTTRAVQGSAGAGRDLPLLARVQAGLRGRSTALRARRAARDPSLQIWSCPGPAREAETVVQILAGQATRAGPAQMRLNEIAMLLADPATSLPLVVEALQRVGLPHQVVGQPEPAPGPYRRGVEALFDLVEEGFTRQAVFRVLANPCWQRTRRADPSMVEAWHRWAAELGIFAGFTPADKCRACELPGRPPCRRCDEPEPPAPADAQRQVPPGRRSPAHTWQLALRRLRLGRLMEPRAYHPAEPHLPLVEGCAPYQDLATGETDTLAAFSVGVEILAHLASALGHPDDVRPCRDWAALLGRLIETGLAVRPDHPEDLAERSGVVGAIERLTELDPLFPSGIPFRLARQLVAAGASGASLTAAGGLLPPFTGGLTVAPLAAAATLPWSQIFIVGLGEGTFPGGGGRSSIDLAQPPPGEPTWQPGLEAVGPEAIQRQALLQALLAARRQVVLTFSCLDPVKEAPLNPSSVLLQLQEWVKAHLLPADDPFPFAVVPTAPLSVRFLCEAPAPGCDPAGPATRIAWLAALRLAASDPDGPLAGHPDLPRWLAEAEARAEALRPPLQEDAAPPGTISLWTSTLSEFLEDPASAVVRRWIRREQEEDDEEWEGIVASPLITEPSAAARLLRRVLQQRFTGTAAAAVDEAAFFARAYAWEQARSATPDGLWGEIERHVLTERFVGLARRTAEALGGVRPGGPVLETITLGRYLTVERGTVLPSLSVRVRVPPAPLLPPVPVGPVGSTPARSAALGQTEPAERSGPTALSSLVARFGAAERPGAPAPSAEAGPEPAGAGGEVEIALEVNGRLPLTWQDGEILHALVFRDEDELGPKAFRSDGRLNSLPRFLLGPVLTFLAILWRQEADDGRYRLPGGICRELHLHQIAPDAHRVIACRPPAEAARRYLTDLCQDYLAQRTCEDLRLKGINQLGFPPEGPAESYAARLAEALARGRWEVDFYSPLLQTMDPPAVPADAFAKVQRRLVPLWERLTAVGAAKGPVGAGGSSAATEDEA
ncbi:MAG: Exodeoxyribonuclease V gamma chain [Candidatus Ozemobacter sibiricus]|uniref:Exodeoxyribonuclease V gamma chain n=1 Tax=Candidatus Ozemobacter sibiricus TaxID=2268124 RepID=A0A367Z8F2_9BACT|nr:MAG: Exodeoxyribonuclease V gamma chain [Candidatus Ozemobacter sibiricus]